MICGMPVALEQALDGACTIAADFVAAVDDFTAVGDRDQDGVFLQFDGQAASGRCTSTPVFRQTW